MQVLLQVKDRGKGGRVKATPTVYGKPGKAARVLSQNQQTQESVVSQERSAQHP